MDLISTKNLKKLIKNPKIKKILSCKTHEITKRLIYNPPTCDIFNKNFIILKKTNEYKFKIEKESKQQLPNIINNQVQILVNKKKINTKTKKLLTKKHKIGVFFSGGPSPGGHNVISGLFDSIKKMNAKSVLFGFIMGPDGIINSNYIKLTKSVIDRYRNLGGFSMIKTSRTKINTSKKMQLVIKSCKQLKLDAVVIIGGDDSNTNAAFLAEKMFHEKIQIISVPKTIDGDIQVKDIKNKTLCATSFGFHTAARSFSNLISSLYTDSNSDAKYWHICKIMGRETSNLTLEVAFQTHPNLTLIGEDLINYIDYKKIKETKSTKNINYSAYGMTLNKLSKIICKAVINRASVGKNFGIILIPEGILEFINEIKIIILKLNNVIAHYNSKNSHNFHYIYPSLNDKIEFLNNLTKKNKKSFQNSLWNFSDNNMFNSIQTILKKGLLTERDSHGNFQFSQLPTEKIISNIIKKDLEILKKNGKYSIGIDPKYYKKIMNETNLNEISYGKAIFKNWNKHEPLLINEKITSKKNLHKLLIKHNLLKTNDPIPKPIIKLYKKSIANFTAQTHFYGYDGRGSNPTRFDCTYAYNLGKTAFHLINNGVTGQMASILNLNNTTNNWIPIGIPIAPLMHLEERNGKPTLVFPKSQVDTNSPAFQLIKILRKNWLSAITKTDTHRIPKPIQFTSKFAELLPTTLIINHTFKNINNKHKL